MVDVVLALKGCDVGPAQRSTTLMAKQTKPPEVICFAKGILAVTLFIFRGEEFRRHYLPTVLEWFS